MLYEKLKRAVSASEMSEEELLMILLKTPSARTLAEILRGRGNLPDLNWRTIASAIKEDLLAIGRLHKIPLIDHLIIGDIQANKPFTSIRSLGLLNFSNK